MQLSLIRFDLLIPLLVSLINVKALEEFSPVATLTPSPTAMPFQQVSSFASPEIEGLIARINSEDRGMERRRDTRRGPGGKSIPKTPISSPSHAATLLAEKLAHDALRSREMQDTMKELTSLKGDHKQHREMLKETEKVFHPASVARKAGHTPKTSIKSKSHSKHKGKENRKHNKHRQRGRRHRHTKRRLKRHHLKKESSKTAREGKSSESINRRKRRGLERKCSSEKSVTCRRKRSDQMTSARKNLDRILEENFEPPVNGDKNGMEELPNFEPTHRQYRGIPISRKDKRDLVHRKRSHMIAQLMITTTRDPTKKQPGDQGVEYSEYYSDDDNILLPEIKALQHLAGEPIRSIRETGDGNLLDEHYYDSSNEHFLQEDVDRLKRDEKKSVKVIEEPSNAMEYVDNTFGPVQANGVADNEKISPYITNFNYIPDQGMQLSNPSAEVIGLRQPMPNQFPSNVQAVFNRNSPIIGSLPNEVPPNFLPSMATNLNANSMVNNVQSAAPGQPSLLGNVVLSQLPQPQLVEGNIPYYSVSEIPLAYSTSTQTSLVDFSASTSHGKTDKNPGNVGVNLLDSEKISQETATTSVATSSSSSGFSSVPSYENYGENRRIPGSVVPSKGTSVPPTSSKAPVASFKMTSSPIAIISTTLDSPGQFSRLRDIRPDVVTPETKYLNYNDRAENIWGPDQIEPIASRDTAPKGSAAKKGKKKGSDSTKADIQSSTTVSDINNVKKHGTSKAVKAADHNLLPTTSSQASLTSGSSTTEPANVTVIGNGTKAVAKEILSEIIGELEVLRLENPKDEQKEGLPCRLTGSWVTARAGVRIDMKVTNHSVRVFLDHLTPPITTEGLLNVTWNVTGFAPFKRGGPFTLLATNNHTKTLAVFVGACKVCQGIDTIEGSWTVSREPRDCRDFQMSTNIFNEIFRRTRLYSAIKDKQSKNETQTLSTTVTSGGNNSTSESTTALHEVSDNLRKLQN